MDEHTQQQIKQIYDAYILSGSLKDLKEKIKIVFAGLNTLSENELLDYFVNFVIPALGMKAPDEKLIESYKVNTTYRNTFIALTLATALANAVKSTALKLTLPQKLTKKYTEEIVTINDERNRLQAMIIRDTLDALHSRNRNRWDLLQNKYQTNINSLITSQRDAVVEHAREFVADDEKAKYRILARVNTDEKCLDIAKHGLYNYDSIIGPDAVLPVHNNCVCSIEKVEEVKILKEVENG